MIRHERAIAVCALEQLGTAVRIVALLAAADAGPDDPARLRAEIDAWHPLVPSDPPSAWLDLVLETSPCAMGIISAGISGSNTVFSAATISPPRRSVSSAGSADRVSMLLALVS